MTTGDLAIPFWFALTAVVAVCGSALWQGELEERLVAVAIVFAWLLSILLRIRYHGPQWAGLVITMINLVIFGALAMRSAKYWPLWLAGFQLLAVITHIARLADETVGAWAYISAGILWTYLQFVALGVGTFGCIRRRIARDAPQR